MYKDFEESLCTLIRELRERIASSTDRTEVIFKITASGRVNEGGFLVTFSIENQYDSECDVKGGSIDAILNEYVRRNSWKDLNAPLCLPNVTALETETEGA